MIGNRRHPSSLLALTITLGIAPAVLATEPSPPLDPGPGDFEVGALVGGGFYQIDTPADPPGSSTFLYGSAFSGYGLVLGATGTYRTHHFFGLQADLLFSSSWVTGSAESASMRREITFGEYALRLALLGKFNIAFMNPLIEIALGPELVWSVGASVKETLTGVTNPDEAPLMVTTRAALFATGQVGVAIDLGSFKIPVALRFGWNPIYPNVTEERFDEFNGPDDPGAFIAGVDWFLIGLAGARFEL